MPRCSAAALGPPPARHLPSCATCNCLTAVPLLRLPRHDGCSFLPGRCTVEVPPRHTPPLLVLQAPEALLQGEQAAVTVTVQAASDGIRDAVLLGRAVHAESQQEVGLVPLAGSAGEPPGAPALAPSDAGSPAGGASPPNAQQGGAAVPLGDLAPGQHRQLVLLLDARYRGTVELAAELRVRAGLRAHALEPLLEETAVGYWYIGASYVPTLPSLCRAF